MQRRLWLEIKKLDRRVKPPKLTLSEYDAKMRAEAERLICEGRMPPLEQVLAVTADVREEYRAKILAARNKSDGTDGDQS
jgi:hypothetical protein